MNHTDFKKLQTLKNENRSAKSWETGSISKANREQVLRKLTEEKKRESQETALLLNTEPVQNGGGNGRALEEARSRYDKHKRTAEELNCIRKTLSKGGTIIQFRRAMTNEIYKVARMLEMPGDLAKQTVADGIELTKDEATWAGHFQARNPTCPEEIRAILRKRDNMENRYEIDEIYRNNSGPRQKAQKSR